MACLENIKGKIKMLRVGWSELFVVFTLFMVAAVAFVLESDFSKIIDSRLVSAYCTSCATAGCGSCSSSASGWRCSCSGYVSGQGYTSCGGVSDSSCSPSSPTATPTPPTYSCAGRCSNTYNCKRAAAYTSSTSNCNNPIGTVTYSTDCSCCFSEPKISECITYTCSRASNTYGCKWATWENKDSDCDVYDPSGSITYTNDCSANFIETDSNCIANCKCPSCSGGTPGSDAYCYAIKNVPPVFLGLVIKNSSGAVVGAETGSRNQICQTSFGGSRAITFEVSASDADGISDIRNITLTLNGVEIPRLSNFGSVTTFGWTGVDVAPDTMNRTSAYPLVVTITDLYGATATNSSRSFKFWNCNLPVSGTVYDSSADGGPTCPNSGFSVEADRSVLNFTSLSFVNGGNSVDMTVSSVGSSYSSGGNYLTWGVNGYVPQFNSNISLSSEAMRSKESSASTWSCGWYIDTTNSDPYIANPTFIADFSGILIQDPWWQTAEGGAISNNEVDGKIPVTCSDTSCKISQNALVAAPTVENSSSKSLSAAQNWYYFGASAQLADVNSNYSYFYNQYYTKNGQGTILDGDQNISSIDTNTPGIYFVNGNLNIDTDVTNSGFLMIIVSGDIAVDQAVTQVNGLYVANNITAAGSNDAQLVFNGSLFASGRVSFTRDHVDRLLNNSIPTVVVNYNPQLIFNLPGSLAKVLTNWQWGN